MMKREMTNTGAQVKGMGFMLPNRASSAATAPSRRQLPPPGRCLSLQEAAERSLAKNDDFFKGLVD